MSKPSTAAVQRQQDYSILSASRLLVPVGAWVCSVQQNDRQRLAADKRLSNNKNSLRGPPDALHQREGPVTRGSGSSSVGSAVDQMSGLTLVVKDQARSLAPPVRYRATILNIRISTVGAYVGILPVQAVLGVGMTADVIPCMEERVEVAASVSPHEAVLDTEGQHWRRSPVLAHQAVRTLPMVRLNEENRGLRRWLARAPGSGERKNRSVRKHDRCVGLEAKIQPAPIPWLQGKILPNPGSV